MAGLISPSQLTSRQMEEFVSLYRTEQEVLRLHGEWGKCSAIINYPLKYTFEQVSKAQADLDAIFATLILLGRSQSIPKEWFKRHENR